MKNRNFIRLILAAIVLCGAVAFDISAADGDVDSSFVSRLFGGIQPVTGVDVSSAWSVVAQPDGKMLVGGTFKSFANRIQNGVARLNADGSPDYAFYPVVNGDVQAIALQADGKILIGGAFTQVSGQARTRVARLNADGTLDATFQNPSANNTVWTITIQADNRILIGGRFDAVGGQARRSLARLNADGSLDATFGNPALSSTSTVYTVAPQTDGKILVGGDVFIGSTFSYFGRLNADGTFDNAFQGYANSTVRKIKIQTDGRILASGSFSRVGSSSSPISRGSIARFNANGSVDASFSDIDATVDPNTIYDFVTLPDGRIIIGGQHGFFAPRPGLTRLQSDGTLDMSFDANVNGQVNALWLQPDGKLLVSGDFNRVRGQSRRSFVRLNADASLDLFPRDVSLNSTASENGRVRALATQPDGKILVGGYFTSAGGRTRRAVVRINPDSSVDATFNDPGITDFFYTSVEALVVQPDGKILVGGDFKQVNGQPRKFIIRLNSDGSLDASFNGNLDDYVTAIALQPDGKIMIGGNFGLVDGQPRGRLARLNQNGSLDPSFNRGTDFGLPYSINILADGRILASGSQVGQAGGLYRYNANGTRDTTFTISSTGGGFVTKSYLQPDGKILIIGRFSDISGQARNSIARLNANGTLDASLQPVTFNSGNSGIGDLVIQSNGKIIITGVFTSINGQDRKNIARLNADGTLDATFNASADATVHRIVLQTDERILIGGDFLEVNGTGADYVARLLNGNQPVAPATARPQFDFDGDGKTDVSVFRPSNGTWYLQQSSNGFAGLQFGTATDQIVPADYDGDGKTDVAVYRSGTWYLNRSQLGFTGVTFGAAEDIAVPADYDGDGKADIAVFRPSNGTWYLNRSQLGFTGVQFGQIGDKPVAADYDGDGKTDVAVYRSGTWYLNRSSLGFTGISFGASEDKPVPADYDGDGKADIAVFRPSNGTWYLQRSQLGFTGIAFGLGTDLPTLGDYDGDGKSDVAVYRASNGAWYLNRSQLGFTGVTFGAAEDRPAPNAFVR